MSEIVELGDWLKADKARFSVRKKMLLFSELIYTASAEKVIEGFRYFACPIESLLAAFESGDLDALSALPFALDEEGDPDTSGVCLLLAYTDSAAFVALQPQHYQDHVPTVVRPHRLIEGDQAKALKSWVRSLDQSS